MPSIRYINQSAPFWDFVADMEQRGRDHPFFSGPPQQPTGEEHRGPPSPEDAPPMGPPPFGPFGWGHPGMPFHGRHRDGPHHGPHHHHRGLPPPFPNEQEKPDTEVKDKEENGEGPSNSGPSDNEEGSHGPGPWRHHHGRCGGRRGRHGFGGRGGWGGPWGGRGGHRGGPFGFGGPFNPFNFAAGMFGEENTTKEGDNKDFEPEADIFDTESSFVIHVSLPGAKKEDVGVNWDQEKSELSIAGVIYRPGDEDFLKTLAMDERKVGPFEKKIRLGTRASPAQIDADMIIAKLEDGVLRVEVPKLDKDFVEIRKVDIE